MKEAKKAVHCILTQMLSRCSAEQVFRLDFAKWISADCSGGLHSWLTRGHRNTGASSCPVPCRPMFVSYLEYCSLVFKVYVGGYSLFAKKHNI